MFILWITTFFLIIEVGLKILNSDLLWDRFIIFYLMLIPYLAYISVSDKPKLPMLTEKFPVKINPKYLSFYLLAVY